jgi:cytochrome c556
MKRLSLVALAVAGVVTALPAAAQFAKPEDAIKYRKAAFTVMAAHFGRVGAMVQGRVPFDAAAAQANLEIANSMAKLPFTAFGPGTDAGDTRAKPNIWSDNAKFTAAATKMQEEMAKLNTAAKSGNLEQIKAAFGPAGGSCKACHDDFRKE